MRDRQIFLAVHGIGIVILLYIFNLTNHSQFVSGLVVTAWLGSLVSMLGYEYWRSYRFYQQLQQQFDQIDQKYLLAEVIDEPDFLEGKFIFTLLQQTNQAMYTHLRQYRQQNREYQEYIELWVHEIKLPIAAAKLTLDNSPSSKEKTNLHLELQRIESYIEQVLYFARMNETTQSFLLRPVQLETVVQQVIQQHARVFIYKKIKVKLSETLQCQVITDQKWLEFILNQIIGNALKYTTVG
ncbi:MAG: sensor histidine kinase, partial [Culicoidibacterales bacterium]